MGDVNDRDLQTAEQIVAHAEAANAGRVTFRDPSGFLFSEPDVRELVNFLKIQKPMKYKLQKLGMDGRWRDVSKYFPMPNSVVEPLQNLNLSGAKRFSSSEFRSAAEMDPQGFKYALRKIFGSIAVAPNERRLKPWKDYFDSVSSGATYDGVLFVRTTLELLSLTLKSGVNENFHQDAIEAALAAIGTRRDRYANEPEQIAYSLVEGKLLSFIDRSAASKSFEYATKMDSEGIIDDFYVDIGAHTYFAPADNWSSPLVHEISRSIEPLQYDESRNSLAITISVDAHFFRIYASQLYLFAQQLPDIDFVFLLCGDRAEVELALDDGENYLRHLTRLNRSGEPDNIQYFRVPVPSSVGQSKTFFACARFFVAEPLLQRYDRVYLMDADLTILDDPKPYFDRIKGIVFGTATNIDLSCLSPWRRNLAGNVILSKDEALTWIIPDLLEYIAYGLTLEQSWMLDQNALAFAAERHSALYTSLNKFSRPFDQLGFRSSWEKRHFDHYG